MHTLVNQSVQSLTIRQLAQRHLWDQSHTTTDEELKNAMLELTNYLYPNDEDLFRSDNQPSINKREQK